MAPEYETQYFAGLEGRMSNPVSCKAPEIGTQSKRAE
jgi:hypothetical protein